MSKNNLELMKWGDGTTRLAFWDSMSGDDLIYMLNEDGTVLLSTGYDESNSETFRVVDLVAELRTLAERWHKEAQAEIDRIRGRKS